MAVYSHLLSDPALLQIIMEFHGASTNRREVFPMYEDKTLVCKECGNEFVFTAGEQEFYAERGSRTSPSAARLAVTLARTLPVAPVSSSPLPALVAAAKQRFPSSPSPTVPFSAASASLRCVLTAKTL